MVPAPTTAALKTNMAAEAIQPGAAPGRSHDGIEGVNRGAVLLWGSYGHPSQDSGGQGRPNRGSAAWGCDAPAAGRRGRDARADPAPGAEAVAAARTSGRLPGRAPRAEHRSQLLGRCPRGRGRSAARG